jgi:WD40 repeat protein
MWNPATGYSDPRLAGHSSSVKALAMLQDGRFASGSTDHTIKLWNTNFAGLIFRATLVGHSSSVKALAVLPDGRLASGSTDLTIKLWDPATANPKSSQPQFITEAAITALAFLPAPPTLVAGDASSRLHWLRLPGP